MSSASAPSSASVSAADKQLEDELVQSMLFANAEEGVDVCFSFDTTGSMYSYLQQVRTNIEETLTALFKDIPKVRIAVIAHGDYCDGKEIVTYEDFCDKKGQDKLARFVRDVPMTGGGDYPEAYEYVLRIAQKLKWNKRSAKALVLIGDAPPHAPSYTNSDIYWRDEIHTLYRKLGVKIYAVQAAPNQHCMPFYQDCARRTGGVYLELRNFALITTMFKAVCYREKSVEALKEFQQSLDKKLRSDELFDKLSQETRPPPLGNYDIDWWDRSNDRGEPEYFCKGSYYEYDSNPSGKYGKKKKVEKVKRELTMGEKIAAERASASTLSGTHTTRTGTRILDTPNPVSKHALPANPAHMLKEVKPGIWEIVPFDPQIPPSDKSKSTKDASRTLTKEQFQENAVKRLMRDLREVVRNPIHNISAAPLEGNMLEWHCNLGGPATSDYADCVFHIIMTFPHNYPRRPPSVSLCTRLFHDNVFGKWICLDMLELGGYAETAEQDRIFTGWSYGYSVLSILLQLQAFLFEGVFPEKHFTDASKKEARAFKCSQCGHSKDNVHPPLPTIEKKAVAKPTASASKPATPASAPADAVSTPDAASKERLKKDRKDRKLAKKQSKSEPEVPPTPLTAPVVAVPAPKIQVPVAPKPTTIKDIVVGQELVGKVVGIREGLGAFVQLSPYMVGLLHVSNMSEKYITNVSEVCKMDQELKVWVTKIDYATKRISLTRLPLQLALRNQQYISLEDLKEGQIRYGIVRRTQNYTGAFVDIGVLTKKTFNKAPVAEENTSREVMTEEDTSVPASRQFNIKVNALLQNKEIGGPAHVWDVCDVLNVGEVLKVKVVKIDKQRSRIWVSSKDIEGKSDSQIKSEESNDERTALKESGFRLLGIDMINEILQYLNPVSAQNIGNTCKVMKKIVADGVSFLWERNELVCFYSKRHFTDDTLGVGLNLENKMNGKLAYITTTFDLVSYEAFMKEKVRKASYKEPFTHWLPLFINKQHGEKAIPLATEAMAKICADCYGHFEPWMVLEVIPKLMNSMVVSVMSGKLWASVMALEGYCAFHHLFLMFLEIYPELKQKVDDTIATFLRDDMSRHKKVIPALGEWIPLLTVTETYSWKDVAVPYLLEMFDRNVLWTLKQYPELVDWDSNTDVDEKLANARLRKTYDATQVSKHLIMFHVYFLDKVARPPGVSLAKVREMLDLRYGKPTFAMKDQLMRECKRIRKVNEWPDFFEYIHMPAPSNKTLTDWLFHAQQNSAKVGYHRPWQFRQAQEEKMATVMAEREERLKKKEKAAELKKTARSDFYEEKYGY